MIREIRLRIRRRIGRRGAILLILAVIDFAYGASLIGPSADSMSSAAVAWRLHFAPLWVWGGAWLAVGVILVASAFLHNDAAGYVAAIALKLMWALTTLLSWMFGGVPRGWVSSIIWGVFAGLLWVVSGWPEETAVPPEGTE